MLASLSSIANFRLNLAGPHGGAGPAFDTFAQARRLRADCLTFAKLQSLLVPCSMCASANRLGLAGHHQESFTCPASMRSLSAAHPISQDSLLLKSKGWGQLERTPFQKSWRHHSICLDRCNYPSAQVSVQLSQTVLASPPCLSDLLLLVLVQVPAIRETLLRRSDWDQLAEQQRKAQFSTEALREVSMKQAQEMLKTLDFMMEMQPDSIKVGLAEGHLCQLSRMRPARRRAWALSSTADRPSSGFPSFWPVGLPACAGAKAALEWHMLTS